MQGASIVVVEDDPAIGRALVQALTGHGASVDWAQTGRDALRVTGLATDVVLLDLGLADLDGLDVCRQLRAQYPQLDIIVVTARSEEMDVVVGLDAGADDYITKPFRLAELLARVRARLRRQELSGTEVIIVGTLTLDTAARRCSQDGTEVDLRAKEFDLLVSLAMDAGRVVPRRRLMADVWDRHFESTTKTLDMHVSALRHKLDRDGKPSIITTMRGIGYRLEARE